LKATASIYLANLSKWATISLTSSISPSQQINQNSAVFFPIQTGTENLNAHGKDAKTKTAPHPKNDRWTG
jgi:hypothetical protein